MRNIATVDLRVSIIIIVVNINQPMKYRPMVCNSPCPPSDSLIASIRLRLCEGMTRSAYHIQYAPYDVKVVAPKVFPIVISHIPARIGISPPYTNPIHTNTEKFFRSKVPTLMRETINVEKATPQRPSGAGFATFRSLTLPNIPGCISPPKA